MSITKSLYTGGLTYLHAATFKGAGINLIYPRWLLFAVAVLGQVLVISHTWACTSSSLVPPLARWLALGWSFPNYFAALPSWWLLICALACLWAFLRYVDTGLLRYAAVAGLAAGISILDQADGVVRSSRARDGSALWRRQR